MSKHPPTRHIKYKVINFAPIILGLTNQLWHKSILDPIWNDF